MRPADHPRTDPRRPHAARQIEFAGERPCGELLGRDVGIEPLRIHVHRCFAADNAQRAGIADQYECGIFARSTGWLDALDLTYELTPPLGKCPKAQGQECVYTLSLSQEAQSPSGSGSGS